MPPEERPVPCFVAEPPQEPAPHGRFGEALAGHFLEACGRIAGEEEIGAPGEPVWFPERTFAGRTYVPATAPTSTGHELFGFISYKREAGGGAAADFAAHADFTDETAEANPGWTLDLSDHEIGTWRGPAGHRGEVTLVWGVALVPDGAIATAELGPTTTDQCLLVNERFTLVSLDDYGGDLLTVKLWSGGGAELAAESLYEEE